MECTMMRARISDAVGGDIYVQSSVCVCARGAEGAGGRACELGKTGRTVTGSRRLKKMFLFLRRRPPDR